MAEHGHLLVFFYLAAVCVRVCSPCKRTTAHLEEIKPLRIGLWSIAQQEVCLSSTPCVVDQSQRPSLPPSPLAVNRCCDLNLRFPLTPPYPPSACTLPRPQPLRPLHLSSSECTLVCKCTFLKARCVVLCVVTYFPALGSLGHFDHSHRSMTFGNCPLFNYLFALFFYFRLDLWIKHSCFFRLHVSVLWMFHPHPPTHCLYFWIINSTKNPPTLVFNTSSSIPIQRRNALPYLPLFLFEFVHFFWISNVQI